jgi:hypothetical protein
MEHRGNAIPFSLSANASKTGQVIEAVGAQRRQEPEADLVSQRRKASAKTAAINSIEFCESGSNPTNHSKMFPRTYLKIV